VPIAPGWPGDGSTVEETRAHPERVAPYGIDDAVAEYAGVIEKLPSRPIVIGHSFGGLVVQRLLGQGLAVGAVAIDPTPIKGILTLPLSSLRVASVALKNPANRNRAVALTREQWRYGFGNAIPAEESDRLFERYAIPSPGRTLFEASTANFVRHSPAQVDTRNQTRGPLLVTAGGRDHTVPASVSRATVKQYRHSRAVTDLKEFPDRGHSLTIDSRWREIADTALAWLKEHGL
jgi:non-heme chloroperoxidase